MDALTPLARGIDHYNAGRFARALKDFREASRGADAPDARCFEAHALAALGRASEAAAAFSAAARRWPKEPAPYLGLAALARVNAGLARMGARLEEARRRLKRPASPALREALAEIVRAQALEAKAADRVDEASRRWRELSRLKPASGEAKRELAELRRKASAGVPERAGERPAAVTAPAKDEGAGLGEVVTAIETVEDDIHSRSFGEAMAALEAALSRRPRDPLGAARAAIQLGDLRLVARIAASAAKVRASHRAAAGLFEVLGLRGRAADALAFEAADPSTSAAWIGQAGAVAEGLGRFEAAAKLYTKAARRGEEVSRLNLARLDLWAGRPDAALRRLRSCAKGPERERLETFCLAYSEPGPRALAALERLLSAKPEDAEARAWLGELLRRAGRAAEARRELERAGREAPSSTGVQVNLALLDLAQGTSGALERAWVARMLGGAPTPERCERLLRTLGGNRTVSPTRVAAGGLRKIVVVNPRGAMRSMQARLKLHPVSQVLESFDSRVRAAVETAERARWSVHRGEVRLWLGDYRGGLQDIEAGLGVSGLMWPPAGAAGARIFLGELDEAERLLAEAERWGTPERVRVQWRGELRRLRGDARGALEDLAPSLKAPFRPWAWLNVGLARAALGRAADARDVLHQLAAARYAFVAAAADVAGFGDARGVDSLSNEQVAAVLRQGLELMRGNRSSWLCTWALPGEKTLRFFSTSQAAGALEERAGASSGKVI